MNYKIKKLNTIMNTDLELGGLSFFEGKRDITFDIKRMDCMYGVDNGNHRFFGAYRNSIQLVFCPYGCVEISLKDGNNVEKVILDEPSKGIVIYPMVWREFSWNVDSSVLCVAYSEYQDLSEEIQNYDEYLAYLNNNDDQ